MHTYLKHENDDGDGQVYSVGQWLPNRDGITSFCTLFDVADRRDAMTAVNLLNGGDTSRDFTIIKEH
jgi:hypothetical protein